jgi:hypothetical protein
MPSKLDGMENTREGWKHNMYHKTSPLFDMKMAKIDPIFQLLKPSYIYSPCGIPPMLDNYITNICFLQWDGIFIFIA